MMLRYEMKKILNKRLNCALFIAALLIVVAFGVFSIGSFNFVDANGKTHSGIFAARSLAADKNRWRGDLTPAKFAEVVESVKKGKGKASKLTEDEMYGKTIQSSQDIVETAGRMLKGESSDFDDYSNALLSANASQVNSIYDIYKENLLASSKEYGTTPEKERYLTKQYQKIHTPLYYEAADSWDAMFLYGTTASLILLVIIGIISAGIFSEEFSYKADSVFFSAQYGKTKATRNKIAAGLITATLVYLIGIGLLSAICFSVEGISGANTPYQFEFPYAIYTVSCRQMYGIIVLGGYIASLLSASVSMLVASRTKTIGIAVCIPFLLFCVSPFVGRALPFRTFFTLTPDQLTNIVNCARIPYIYQIGSVVFSQIPFLILFYLIIAILLLPIVYRNYNEAIL